MTLNPDLIDQSQEWADSVHRDMLAATLLDPNMIAFRSAALDVPEAIIKNQLLDEMAAPFQPQAVKDLQSFLPNLVDTAMK